MKKLIVFILSAVLVACKESKPVKTETRMYELTFVDGKTEIYTIKNVDTEGAWILNTKKAKVLNIDSTSITIEITTSKSGSFNLQYIVGDQIAAELSVTIGSL